MFIRVSYLGVGTEIFIMVSNSVSFETLKEQFPGSVGLKYMENGIWKCVPATPTGFLPPEGGLGDRKYVVVTESIGMCVMSHKLT